jgi:hypothetical protein
MYSTYKYSNYWDEDYSWKKPKSFKSKKSYWSRSGWESFAHVSLFEEDEDLFVKNPENYVTPSKMEIKKKVNAYKDSSIKTIKELCRVCYFKMIEEKDYLSDSYKNYDDLCDPEKQEYEQKKSFYDSLYDQFIPGFTPLEQAIAIFLKMKTVDACDSDPEKSEIDMTKGLDFNRDVYSDPNINEQLEINELSKDRKIQIMNLISLIGDFGTQFKVEKEIDEKIVSNSDEYVTKIMRDYSQFHMINLYQKMFPNFKTKFLTKDLTVNVPVDRKEQKQKIIIILDFSGSMSDYEKQIWVNAILIDRFRYVMKGEAEVFFSYFVDNSDELHFQHIKNKEDVIKFWQTFSNDPNGGMTEVGLMVSRIANEISNGRLMNLNIDLSGEKPEILVINDGQDDIGIDEFPYKVNALCLMEQNYDLKDLCINSGGKKIHVNEENVITMYSSEGEKVLT